LTFFSSETLKTSKCAFFLYLVEDGIWPGRGRSLEPRIGPSLVSCCTLNRKNNDQNLLHGVFCILDSKKQQSEPIKGPAVISSCTINRKKQDLPIHFLMYLNRKNNDQNLSRPPLAWILLLQRIQLLMHCIGASSESGL
jgi:hypothetical protein